MSTHAPAWVSAAHSIKQVPGMALKGQPEATLRRVMVPVQFFF